MRDTARLFAQDLIANPFPGDETARRVANRLRLPDTNPDHAGRALVDRFVLSEADLDTAWNSIANPGEDGLSQAMSMLRTGFRPPLPCFWIEAGGKWRGSLGAYYEDGAIWFFLKTHAGVIAHHVVTETAIRADSPHISHKMGKRVLTLQHVKEYSVAGVVLDSLKAFLVLIAAINTPCAATVERVVRTPRGEGPGITAFPLGFSYNRVTLNVPGIPHDHGVERVGPGRPLRGHMVRGFWRLIWTTRSGDLDAEWVWVDGFPRGNPALGWITKERHVTLATEKTRKGFAIPTEPGRPGERRKAVRK